MPQAAPVGLPSPPMQQTPSPSPLEIGYAPFRAVGIGKALAGALALGVLVCGFLFWLIYFKAGSPQQSATIARLPAVNATLNSLSAAFLVTGYRAVRRGDWRRHMRWMFAALAASSLFFVSYVVYHNYHGDTKFRGVGPIKGVYFFILISHIVLSVVVVPMILLSFFLALSGRLTAHRRLSRYTFPIWLYVSVTGVLVFAMLKAFSP
jgi:putative membrane protein